MASTQMSTPLNSLPLKTTQDQSAQSPQSPHSIDDPLIQNVLKEFEDEYNSTIPVDNYAPETMPPPSNQCDYGASGDSCAYLPPSQPSLDYSKNNKDLFKTELIKKAVALTILVILLQKTNVLDVITKYVPEYLAKYVSGNEFVIYGVILFFAMYAVFYTNML